MAKASSLPATLKYLEPVRKQLAALAPDDIHEDTDLSILRRVVRKRVNGLSREEAETVLAGDAADLEKWLSTPQRKSEPLHFIVPILPDAMDVLFPERWPDNPDAAPPPGRAVAQGLLDSLLSSGRVSPRTRTIDGDSHEHNMWYFDFDFDGIGYHIEIAGAIEETTVNRWMVVISRSRGVLSALFGKREGYFDVPDNCLDLVAKSLCHIFGLASVSFLTADEADREFYGIRRGGPVPRD